MGNWLDANMNWFSWIVGIVLAAIYFAATRNRKMRVWQHLLALIVIGVFIGLGLGVVADLLD